jgi:hypothetical protein
MTNPEKVIEELNASMSTPLKSFVEPPRIGGKAGDSAVIIDASSMPREDEPKLLVYAFSHGMKIEVTDNEHGRIYRIQVSANK